MVRLHYGGQGDDFAIFLEVIIAGAEFYHGAIVKGFLIVPDELFPVISLQREQGYLIWHGNHLAFRLIFCNRYIIPSGKADCP